MTMPIGNASEIPPVWERAWYALGDFLASNEMLVIIAVSIGIWVWMVRRIVRRRA